MEWWQAFVLYAILPALIAAGPLALYLGRKQTMPADYYERNDDFGISEEEWMNAMR